MFPWVLSLISGGGGSSSSSSSSLLLLPLVELAFERFPLPLLVGAKKCVIFDMVGEKSSLPLSLRQIYTL